ncbi:MAG: glycosyltransferase family 39 protein [Bryobacterales bacterium]|nr:glycosyltransferase family 39 protein [Bryobacterales bacterium]
MARTPLAYARILLALLLAVNLYRAATISVSTDEAYTYNRSVSVPIPELWKTFDANDHVLHTLLCKVSIRLFGVSEFSLRIPALLGGLLLLAMCLRLCRLLFGDTWRMLLAFSLLALNPFILDYCSVARGYGLATALFLTALDQLLRLLPTPTDLHRLYIAGIALALGVTANLTIVIPGIALTIVFAMLFLGPPLLERHWPRFRVRTDALLDRMIVPGVILSTAILLVPLLPAKKEHFYLGSDNWKSSLLSLAYANLWRPLNPLEHTPLHEPVMAIVESIAIPLPIAILTLALYRWRRNREPLRALLTFTAIASFTLLAALNATLGMRLPERRTGLYLVPLLTLLAVFILDEIRWTRHIGNAAAALTLLQFLLSFNVRYYDEWNFDAGCRQLVQYLRDHAPPPGRRVSLHATFPLPHSVEFYRRYFGLEWLDVSREIEARRPHDVYLLTPEELPLMQKLNLTERYVQPISNITLATAASSPLQP